MPVMPIGRKSASIESRLAPGALIDYEQHGKLILGVVLRERKSNWVVLNPEGKEVELPSARLYLYPGNEFKGDLAKSGVKELTSYIIKVSGVVEDMLQSLSLEELWDVVRDEVREYSPLELAELTFSNGNLPEGMPSSLGHLAMRRGLLLDTVYFKRRKVGFEPRGVEVVEDLKRQLIAEQRKASERRTLIDQIRKAMRGEKVEFPATIEMIEDLAVNGGKSPRFKEASLMLDEIADALIAESPSDGGAHNGGFSLRGKTEERAFELLVRIGIFKPDEHLALIRSGVRKTFPCEVDNAARDLSALNLDDPTTQVLRDREDLTSLFVVSIDAADTTDIDDALSIASSPDGFIVGIHISDVASLIADGSILDQEAKHRATSLYFPDAKIPMLPPVLSEGVASLWSGKKRLALSFHVEISRDGSIISRKIAPSLIRVAKKLSYDFVDNLLENGGGDDHENRMIASTLSDLWTVASLLEQGRLSRGAVFISRREVFPVVDEAGHVRLDEWQEDTPARKLVSELMILANETGALFARERAINLIFRSQEPPDDNSYGDARDPDSQSSGARASESKESATMEAPPRVMMKPSTVSSLPGAHSGLGLKAYAQMTSPIRRYYDLINQRQILSALGFPQEMQSKEKIDDLILQEENVLGEARTLQKERTRYWLLKYLQQERIKELTGTVLRVDGPKPLAEIDLLGANLLFRSPRHRPGNTFLKVGERVTLSVERVEPRNDDLVLVDRGRG